MGLWIIDSHDSFKTRIHSEPKHTAVLLGDGQFCYGFKGNYVLCKTEQKQTILCLKYNPISTYYLLNCCIKSHLNSWYSGQSALVWYCSRCSCDIDDKIWDKNTYTGIFAPISWIVGHNCIYGVVALHHICQQSNVLNVRWCTGLGAGQCVNWV